MHNHGSFCTHRPIFRTVRRVSAPLILASLLSTLFACSSEENTAPSIADQAPEKPISSWKSYEDSEAQNFANDCQTRYNESEKLYRQIEDGNFSKGKGQLLDNINELDRQFDNAFGRSSLFSNVHPNAELRKAAEECQQQLVTLASEVSLSRPIYDQINAVDTTNFSVEDKRYVEHYLRDLRRSGVNLNKDKRDRVKALNEEILQLGQTFGKNVREDVRSVTVDSVEQLDGLPADYLEKHPADSDGKITITTNYPDYIPISQYAKNDTLRFDLYKVYKQRGHPDNVDILQQLLEKRFELAQLVGYKNYAEYVTETVMIKSPQNAEDFINKISAAAQAKAQIEYDELLQKLKSTDPSATAVGDWQKTYLADLIKKEKYQVDSQEVRQYFQYKNVTQGIFDLVETMFNVEIRPWETDVWHPSVKAYELLDNGKVLGRFYLDMHPRDGKYKHAAAFSLQEGLKGIQLPTHALVCNFPGEQSGDELMEHGQVETYLHEFGHLLHGLFGGNQKWLGNAGTSTERDFVEAPSQMLEEWVWDADTLKSFAKNKKGETIPDALIEKMNNARDYGKGLFTRHQMYYASISLSFYNQDPKSLDMVKALETLKPRYSNFGYVEDTYFHESFGHLYGYSAVYYTYMWSLVIASDMFSEFQKHGLRNPEIADKYRRMILEPGGSKDAAELVRDFLGRDYNFEAFAKSLN